MLYPIMFFIFLSYYDFDEYSLVFVLSRMSKRLESVTKKLFGGKSRAWRLDTGFHGCSTTNTRRAEMLKHVDPSLVPTPTSQTMAIPARLDFFSCNLLATI
jgi:hypothetical protein